MDKRVLEAMDKWPNVPALFGWLRLDRRGYWHLKGRLVERPMTLDFIGRNYTVDDHGRWFFQNGPQQAFVDLDYTPWVYRSQADGALTTHTGLAVEAIEGAWLDEAGSLLLQSVYGIGVLDDHDLAWALERFQDPDGGPASAEESHLLKVLEDASVEPELMLAYGDARVPVQRIDSAGVPERFGFVREPAPLPGEKGERPTPSE